MGRTLALVSRPGGGERYDRAANNPFPALGFEFSVVRRGERIFHRVVRRDRESRVITEREEEALLALGSGRHGHSYVLSHDGYLFHSAIGWYGHKSAWDVAPEFKENYPRLSPIGVRCLFCHSNEVKWVEGSLNHFEKPELHSHAIGCERCHGPGELHVAARTRAEQVPGAFDDTIVNPRHLPPALREAVCQQCHLRGQAWVLGRGRRPFDFRPGLPLQLFRSTFVRRPERADARKLGHVEQMYLSRCFQQTDGKMGCISCHDPHVLPTNQERVAFFRGRCLTCHAETSCGLAVTVRRKQQKEDDCTACHMPPIERAGISHEAVTDHRILRRGQDVRGRAAQHGPVSPEEMPVISFYADRRDLQDKDMARDLGIALAEFGWEGSVPFPEIMCRRALPLLETAVETWPEDVPALEAKGFALAQLGRGADALKTFQAALALVPNRERTLSFAAQQAELRERNAEAIAYWRRAVAVNPWMPEYHYRLAKLLAGRDAWPEALSECEAALRCSPASEETRLLLITCSQRSGDKARARREFETLLALEPKNPDLLRRWFDEQSR
jgi:Flp pilus assembly protein TadD